MSAGVIAVLYAFAETPGALPGPAIAASGSSEADFTGVETASADLTEAEFCEDFPAQENSAGAADGLGTGAAMAVPGADPDLWLYRKRTVGLLRRYMRLSIEVGRLPSLLGREFFRTRVTRYRASTFEDAVIFVHDVERSLEKLSEFDKKLIAKIVLQEYSQEEAAVLIGCGRRHMVRCYPEALDRVTEIFLKRELLARLPPRELEREKPCQGGESNNFCVSDSEQTENKY